MNARMLNDAMNNLKSQAGNGLLGSSIVDVKTSMSLASYSASGKGMDTLVALISQFTDYSKRYLSKDNLFLKDYYCVLLESGVIFLILLYENYIWSILVDTKDVPMGMLLNVIAPDCSQRLSDAINA